jgi:hypothetical protein
VLRGLKGGVLAAALAASLPGSAHADGGLLDVGKTEAEEAKERADLVGAFRKVELAKVPAAVRGAADGVVPGLRVAEATEICGWTPFALRDHAMFRMKGRDADGREVTVSVRDDGSRPAVIRPVALASLPDKADLAKARAYAAEHGYTLTRAVHVVRNIRVMGRYVRRWDYYLLRGARPDRPGVERLVWLSGDGGFGLRDLEDLWWTKLTD